MAKDYADLARLGGVSRARMTRIMDLLNLAPDLQEEMLFVPPVPARLRRWRGLCGQWAGRGLRRVAPPVLGVLPQGGKGALIAGQDRIRGEAKCPGAG